MFSVAFVVATTVAGTDAFFTCRCGRRACVRWLERLLVRPKQPSISLSSVTLDRTPRLRISSVAPAHRHRMQAEVRATTDSGSRSPAFRRHEARVG